jgi:hypothetical protein
MCEDHYEHEKKQQKTAVWVIIILALLALVGIFSGCNNKSNGESGNPDKHEIDTFNGIETSVEIIQNSIISTGSLNAEQYILVLVNEHILVLQSQNGMVVVDNNFNKDEPTRTLTKEEIDRKLEELEQRYNTPILDGKED